MTRTPERDHRHPVERNDTSNREHHDTDSKYADYRGRLSLQRDSETPGRGDCDSHRRDNQ